MLINLFLTLIVGLMQSAPANPPGGPNVIPKTTEPQTVEFCELLRKAKDCKDKEVRVRAIYRTDFEESSLHSPQCYAPLYVWVKFDPVLRKLSATVHDFSGTIMHALLPKAYVVPN